jgi:hypothetical protein
MASSRTEEERQAPGGPPGRRFLLLDAMALVLAAAVMLSAREMFRWLWVHGNPDLSFGERELARHAGTLALLGLSCSLLPFMLARSGDRRRLRQGAPGLLVHLVAVVAFGWMLVEWAMRDLVLCVIWKTFGSWTLTSGLIYIVITLGMPMSLGVAIAWFTLAIVGRWRPDRGWDDRLGRLVGCLWLVYGPSETLVTALMAH